ncbi:MAG: NmrA family NAD(P)-binding protein [Caldilineaceae bacterium]
MILLTGAAGKTGRAVSQALVEQGQSVRAFVHRPAQRQPLLELGVQEVFVGDLRDGNALRQAVAGVRAIYHICPNVHPDEVAIGRDLIAAARAAEVAHFVYHSVLHPQTETMPHHWNKLRVEELLLGSGLPFTILQPTVYMQNLLAGWQSIVEEGIYTIPYPVTCRLSLIDLADVGAAAAQVLTTPGHLYATYELAGTEPLAQSEVATILSTGLGRPVEAKTLALAEWERNARAAGMGDYAVDTLRKMFRYYARFGLAGNPSILRWLLGRAPRTLPEFVQSTVAAGD